MSMVEIIAKQLWDIRRTHSNRYLLVWDIIGPDGKSEMLDMARTALLAIRDNATPGMWDAAWDAGEDYFVGDSVSASGLKKALEAMLNEALKEGEV